MLKCSEAATVVRIGLLQIPLSSVLHHSGSIKFVHLNVFCPPSGTRGCVRNVEQISCVCVCVSGFAPHARLLLALHCSDRHCSKAAIP